MADTGGAGLGSLIGLGGMGALSMVGELLAQKDKGEQARILQKALEEYGSIELPALQKVMAEELGPSALSGVSANPEYVSAQKDALNTLAELAKSGGMTLADMANLNTIQNRLAHRESAGRQSIREGMQGRGVGGSGAELAMQLQGNQQAAQQAGERGLDIAGQAQKRALDAMLSRGRLAGDMRGQDYSERARAAEAQDSVSRWNAESRGRANMYNAGLSQQGFENKMRLTGAKQGLYGQQAGLKGQNADDTRGAFGGLGEIALGAGRTADAIYNRDQKHGGSRGYGKLPYGWKQYEQSDPDEWANPFGGY